MTKVSALNGEASAAVVSSWLASFEAALTSEDVGSLARYVRRGLPLA